MKQFSAQSYFEPQYVLRQTLPAFHEHIAEWERLSEERYFSANASHVVSYGEHPRQNYELLKVAEGHEVKGLAVFIHGGFWRAMDREQSRFVAQPFLANGYDCVIAEYRLMPEFRLENLVQDTADMLSSLADNRRPYSLADNVILAGHSAGAHLAVFGLQRARQMGVSISDCSLLLLSGVFDIYPVSKTSIGDDLRMSDEEIKRWSLYDAKLELGTEPLFVAGEIETDEFKRQTIVGAQQLGSQGVENILFVPEANHLSLMTEFAVNDDLNRLCLAMLAR